MTTIAEFRARAIRRLTAGRQAAVDVLVSAIDADDTTLTLTLNDQGLAAGQVIEIGSEEILVPAYDDSTGVASTLIRGWNGTTAAAHDAGAVVRIAPAVTAQTIAELIVEELRSWPPQLGRVVEVEVEPDGTGAAVELDVTDEVRMVLDAKAADAFGNWRPIDPRFVLDFAADDFASGIGVHLDRLLGPTDVAQFILLQPYDLSDLSDDRDLTTDLGIPASLEDALMWGLTARFLPWREVLRTDASARVDADRREAHPPTYSLQATQAFAQMRDQRLAEEQARLIQRFPIIRTFQ